MGRQGDGAAQRLHRRGVVGGAAAVEQGLEVVPVLNKMDLPQADPETAKAEIEDVIGMIGEHPDLWDFVLGSWEDDSVTSRFGPEAAQEPYVRGLKALTTKPVVGVGRFTSPDMMVHQIKSGVFDLIGAAVMALDHPAVLAGRLDVVVRREEDGGQDARAEVGAEVLRPG